MKQLFEINGIRIYKGVCTVDFSIESEFFPITDITHGRLYSLLENAKNIVINEKDITFYQGDIKITAYVHRGATLAK